jgi:hypothetical protein
VVGPDRIEENTVSNRNIRATPAPSVIYTEMESEEAVLLNLDTQKYYSLNQTGACIWRSMGEGKTIDQIARDLEKRFDVDSKLARQSVIELLEALAADKLVALGEVSDSGADGIE